MEILFFLVTAFLCSRRALQFAIWRCYVCCCRLLVIVINTTCCWHVLNANCASSWWEVSKTMPRGAGGDSDSGVGVSVACWSYSPSWRDWLLALPLPSRRCGCCLWRWGCKRLGLGLCCVAFVVIMVFVSTCD